MTRNQALDAVSALEHRCGLVLSCSDWHVLEVPGGVAMSHESISALAVAASKYSDTKAVAYEMESVNQDFDPVEVEISDDGMRQLRTMMISHFDLLLVPESRRWVVLLSNEMESIFFGPEKFLADFTIKQRHGSE